MSSQEGEDHIRRNRAEPSLREQLTAVLPTLAPTVDYSTLQIATRISPSQSTAAVFAICTQLQALVRRYPALADHGPERPGKGAMKGKMVRPWLWRHMTREAVATAFASGNDRDSRLDRLEQELTDLRLRVDHLELDR